MKAEISSNNPNIIYLEAENYAEDILLRRIWGMGVRAVSITGRSANNQFGITIGDEDDDGE